jgi:hypothetical protein
MDFDTWFCHPPYEDWQDGDEEEWDAESDGDRRYHEMIDAKVASGEL